MAGPAGNVALSVIEQAVALEQSLIRLPPRVTWPALPAARLVANGSTNRATPPKSVEPQRTARAQRGGAPRAGGASRAKAESAALPARPEAALGTLIGVISDNHGYLDPAVLEIFAGVTHIIHAGDIMDPEILGALRKVAPVTAVAGNMDSGDLALALPREVVGEVAGVRFLVGHKRKRLLKELAAGGIAGLTDGVAPNLVVYGHDHVAAATWVDGTLYLNPGSASAPHEEDDDPTVAVVEVRPAGLAVTFAPLARMTARATSSQAQAHGEDVSVPR